MLHVKSGFGAAAIAAAAAAAVPATGGFPARGQRGQRLGRPGGRVLHRLRKLPVAVPLGRQHLDQDAGRQSLPGRGPGWHRPG